MHSHQRFVTPSATAALLSLVALAATLPTLAAGELLVPKPPIAVPGGSAGFDSMMVDAPLRRLLAAHRENGTLAIINLDNHQLSPSPHTGATQGIAVDERDNEIYAGNEKEETITVLDRKTFAHKATIKVEGPVDAVVYDPRNGRVYAVHDEAKELWVIDAKTHKRLGSVVVAGAPEFAEYDPGTDRIYQNIKSTDEVAVIDPAHGKVTASWSTLPAKSPHGLVIDGKTGHLFSAGRNGKLVMLDLHTGKVLGSVDIATGADQIAIDTVRHRIYCGCKENISVAEESGNTLKSLGNVSCPKGAHTLAVDPKTHSVWISFADGRESYLQEYAAP